jgi:hypothetical protein
MRNPALIAAFALLVGCSNPPQSGVIKDKFYHPGFTYPSQICVGSPVRCSVILNHIPDSWSMDIEIELPGGQKEVQNHSIDYAIWSNCTVGDKWLKDHCRR